MGNLVFQATLGGQVNLVGPNTASTYNIAVPAVSGTMVTTGDTGTVTNTMLAGSIANAKLLNSSVTIGSTAVSLGATVTAFAGITTLAMTGNLTLSGGTANGVAYLNGSNVVTTGSALTFDGTYLYSGGLRLRGLDTSNTIYQPTGAFNITSQDSYIGIKTLADVPLIFSVNSAEQMRLTSTGLGIGTSSPGQKLDVRGNVMAGNGTIQTVLSYDTMGAVGTFSNHGLHILTNSTVVGTFDTSGNLGLGVTPSAWDTNSRAIQLRNSGGLYDLSFGGVSTYTFLSNNSYRSSGGTDRYLNSYAASNYLQNNGSHIWNNAPSGTAGNAITFTQAMTLDASGSLLVGRTARLNTEKFSVLQAAGSDGIALTDATNYTSFWSITSAGAALNSNGALIFGTGSSYTERARIDSSGNLLVGTTTKAGNGNTFYSGTSGQQAISIWNGATSGNNYFLEFGTEGTYTARGSITYNRGAGLVAYNVASDYRAKDVYGPVVDSGAVIDSTPVYMGKMKGATQERPMFIAHETPAYAHTGEKDAVDADGNPVFQQMDASALVPVMWAEIQSLRARLKAANIA